MIARAGLSIRRGSLNGPSMSASGNVIHRPGTLALASTFSPQLAESSISHRQIGASQRKRYQSSNSAALRPTPTLSAAVEGTTPNSSHDPFHYQPYTRPGGKGAKMTQLPTPMPSDVLERRSTAFRKHLDKEKKRTRNSLADAKDDTTLRIDDLSASTFQSLNQNDSFFIPSQTLEDMAILRACLATGLTQRAIKVFDIMREDVSFRSRASRSSSEVSSNKSTAYSSPLDVKVYNAMLGTFLRKSYQEDSSEETRRWVHRAWRLFQEMELGLGKDHENLVNPVPDEGTFAVMAKGVVRLLRSNRYPSHTHDLSHLLLSLRRSGLRLQDVLTSSVFTHQQGEMESFGGVNVSREGEPNAKVVLHSVGAVIAEMGDLVLSSELAEVTRIFQDVDAKAMQEAVVGKEMVGDEMMVDQVPELRPVTNITKSKPGEEGEGESEIVFNLRVLRENLSIVQEARKSSAEPYERQHWLEFGAIDAARKRFEAGETHLEAIGLSNAGSLLRKDLQRWMWSWYKKLEATLEEDIERMLQEESEPINKFKSDTIKAQILPFLQLVSPGKMAMIAIMELMRMHASSGSDGMKTANALISIGKAVEREHYANTLQKNAEWLNRRRMVQNNLRGGGLTNMELRKELKKVMADEPNTEIGWTTNIRARVGSYLVQHLMEVATVKRTATDRDGIEWNEDQAAFYSAYQYIHGKRLGVIRLNEVVAEKLARDSSVETLHPRHLPMLVPPNPWIRYDSGGYLSVKSKALRFKGDFEQASYLKAASENGSLEYVLSGLDVLGSTAWTINNDVFKIVTEVWNSGKAIADMPPLELGEEEPIRQDNYETDMRARADYLSAMKQHVQKKRQNHAQRCEVNYRLEIARAFLNERFYFPHNMDFRGRAYPLPPHLNHIGNDVSRGLLLFADAKPLGKEGLRWLRIHLANVYGYDKASFTEREQFALDHEEDMRKSVADPLGEGNWWLQADDPWQCLASCMELIKAYDHPQGPEKFESRLPVHQDGTCNGLQHYAALGGDMAGAEQVNLRGKDRPSDVYTAVADLVIEQVKKDAEKGIVAAQNVSGKITRKVVKQTVMTTVYGVTFIGAKGQVAKQLVDRGLPGNQIWTCSSYLAKLIMASIGDLFSGAEAIQLWLKESALLIAKSIPPERLDEVTKRYGSKGFSKVNATRLAKEQMTSVIWTTPLGLPVVQPYRKDVRKQVFTGMQTIYIKDPHLASQVSSSKQASAFPPNFIHSLDATHMFLTALECQSAGLTFASVHDSYWTHACDIETMSDLIRSTFVRLHSCDILPKLKEEFLDRYKGHTVPVLVAKTSMAKQAKRSAEARKRLGIDSSAIVVEEKEDGKLETQLTPNTFKDAARDAPIEGIKGNNQIVKEDVTDQLDDEIEDSQVKAAEEENDSSQIPPGYEQQFVLLKDVLPDIPKRGTFDVNEIKRSLYFFS